MTTIGLWKCDICHKEFRSDRGIGFDDRSSLIITIPNCEGMANSIDKTYTFSDTCLDCRVELCAVIKGLLYSHTGHHEE